MGSGARAATCQRLCLLTCAPWQQPRRLLHPEFHGGSCDLLRPLAASAHHGAHLEGRRPRPREREGGTVFSPRRVALLRCPERRLVHLDLDRKPQLPLHSLGDGRRAVRRRHVRVIDADCASGRGSMWSAPPSARGGPRGALVCAREGVATRGGVPYMTCCESQRRAMHIDPSMAAAVPPPNPKPARESALSPSANTPPTPRTPGCRPTPHAPPHAPPRTRPPAPSPLGVSRRGGLAPWPSQACAVHVWDTQGSTCSAQTHGRSYCSDSICRAGSGKPRPHRRPCRGARRARPNQSRPSSSRLASSASGRAEGRRGARAGASGGVAHPVRPQPAVIILK